MKQRSEQESKTKQVCKKKLGHTEYVTSIIRVQKKEIKVKVIFAVIISETFQNIKQTQAQIRVDQQTP